MGHFSSNMYSTLFHTVEANSTRLLFFCQTSCFRMCYESNNTNTSSTHIVLELKGFSLLTKNLVSECVLSALSMQKGNVPVRRGFNLLPDLLAFYQRRNQTTTFIHSERICLVLFFCMLQWDLHSYILQ